MPRRTEKQPPKNSAKDEPKAVSQSNPAVVLANPETCAFRALQAVKAAEHAANQTIDLTVRLGRTTVEMIDAVCAAFEARRAAALAEKAATDPRYKNPYETARVAYGEASQGAHRAELALRQLMDRLPDLFVEAPAESAKSADAILAELLGGNPFAKPSPSV